jgi:hypothetical protein
MPPETRLEWIRRHRGDWLAQFLWSYLNKLETPEPLPAGITPSNPRSDGRIDPATGILDPGNTWSPGPRGPEAYHCFIPPEPRIGYEHGESHTITTAQIDEWITRLANANLLRAMRAYAAGGSFGIYRWKPSRNAFTRTSTCEKIPGIADAALLLSDLTPMIGPQGVSLQVVV